MMSEAHSKTLDVNLVEWLTEDRVQDVLDKSREIGESMAAVNHRSLVSGKFQCQFDDVCLGTTSTIEIGPASTTRHEDLMLRSLENLVIDVTYDDISRSTAEKFLSRTVEPLTKAKRFCRNERCYCGSGRKYKKCHGR
jgi:hypothetical protein